MYSQAFKKKTNGQFLKKSASVLMAGTFLIAAAGTGLNASETRQHDAHVHGVANLNVALDGSVLMIELDSPAANIVGFEHAPENEEQAHAVEEAIELLKNGERLFDFSEKAQCTLHDAHVNTDMETGHHDEHDSADKHHDDDSHGHDDHDKNDEKAHAGEDHDHDDHGSSHSEFEVAYHFECTNPDEVGCSFESDLLVFAEGDPTYEINARLLDCQSCSNFQPRG